MSAPPASFPNASHHGTNHANECDESHYRIEPSDDDIRDDNPIEVYSWCRKVAMEFFLLHNPFCYSLNFPFAQSFQYFQPLVVQRARKMSTGWKNRRIRRAWSVLRPKASMWFTYWLMLPGKMAI